MSKVLAGPRFTFLFLSLALFSLYLVTHPYRGVLGDALIYVTRAWAPPALVQGDMLFAHEHQTSLTLFGALLRALIAILPVAEAARLLALCGVALWFVGLLAFTLALARQARLSPAMALAMAALVGLAPLGYSAGSSFTAGEFLAVPRPMAEGFVLIAFAAMLDGRRAAGLVALLAAAAFHPLMGLAGAAVAFIWAASCDRRVWLLAVVGAGAALAGAALGLPVLSNLLISFDADWLALLRTRTSYLFLSQAPTAFWVDLLLRGAILLIAWRGSEARVRAFFGAVLIASAGAVLLSLILADLWPSLLITQLQPWRVLFVPAVIAPAALALIAAREQGRRTRITLGFLACAYMTRDAAMISMAFSLGALAHHFSARATMASARVEALLWIVTAAAWISFDLIHLMTLAQIFAETPRDKVLQWSYLWALRPLSLPLAMLVVFVSLRATRPSASFAALLALGGVSLAFQLFDDRTPLDRSLEAQGAPEIINALPAGDGPVLWLGLGKEPWYWLRRSNWVAPVQASSIVFSRDLALAWSERTRFLIDRQVYAPDVLGNRVTPGPTALAPEAIEAICARRDAPAAIVVPLQSGAETPPKARRVAAPAPSFVMRTGDSLRFDQIDSYAVWRCAQVPER